MAKKKPEATATGINRLAKPVLDEVSPRGQAWRVKRLAGFSLPQCRPHYHAQDAQDQALSRLGPGASQSPLPLRDHGQPAQPALDRRRAVP